ncbi:hypothetical protein [Lysobacter gummosus]
MGYQCKHNRNGRGQEQHWKPFREVVLAQSVEGCFGLFLHQRMQ